MCFVVQTVRFDASLAETFPSDFFFPSFARLSRGSVMSEKSYDCVACGIDSCRFGFLLIFFLFFTRSRALEHFATNSKLISFTFRGSQLNLHRGFSMSESMIARMPSLSN